MSVAAAIEDVIKRTVVQLLSQSTVPELPTNASYTDSIAEVIEKLCILHIRTWHLEDAAGTASSDAELADIKRKIDICFKQKRPQLVQSLNSMIDQSVITEKRLQEDSVKLYKGIQ